MAIQFLSSINITGTTSVSSISNDDNAYTGILVWDGGLLKYRTKAQILSDIGAGTGNGSVTSVTVTGNSGLSGTGTVTSSGTITLSNSDKGSSQSIFKTIAVSGQISIAASSNTDTLKFAGGGGTTITINASSKTVTISSTDNNTNYYVTSLSFNTSNGVLTVARNGLTSLTVDLDGRYATTSGVTSVSGTGTVSGLSLSGTVTGSGNLTLGGTLSLSSANVTTALGFTPYSNSNPSGFTNVTNNNQITNGAGFTTNRGTIERVLAGTGISGGGSSGTVTITSTITQALPAFSMLTCSTTTITTNTNGVANAVVMKFDTESITYGTADTIIVYGSGGIEGVEGSQFIWTIDRDTDNARYFQYEWNVTSNTNTVNNRLLSGIRIEEGTLEEGALSWAVIDPTTSYIYDRGVGAIRKGSTAGSIILKLLAGSVKRYYRMQFWKESASNAGVKSESVLNGTQMTIKQLV
jgi:hypothetical protein